MTPYLSCTAPPSPDLPDCPRCDHGRTYPNACHLLLTDTRIPIPNEYRIWHSNRYGVCVFDLVTTRNYWDITNTTGERPHRQAVADLNHWFAYDPDAYTTLREGTHCPNHPNAPIELYLSLQQANMDRLTIIKTAYKRDLDGHWQPLQPQSRRVLGVLWTPTP